MNQIGRRFDFMQNAQHLPSKGEIADLEYR